jgi:hypothetical protein
MALAEYFSTALQMPRQEMLDYTPPPREKPLPRGYEGGAAGSRTEGTSSPPQAEILSWTNPAAARRAAGSRTEGTSSPPQAEILSWTNIKREKT